jgi:uncharacterized protein
MEPTHLLNFTTPGTAVITGASSGLGLSFAKRLASYGFNLVLVARRKERLQDIAARLESEHSITCEPLIADLANVEEIEKVVERILRISDLDILINNAGFATQGLFRCVPMEKNIRMLHVHMTAPMRFCHAALRIMDSRQRGVIINVASTGAFILMPGSVLYGATKSFVVKFSENLQQEIKGSGIKIQALCPGFIRTEFHEVGDFHNFDRSTIPDYLWMTPEKVVTLSLKALEKKGKTVFIPGWRYRVIKWFFNNVSLVRLEFKKKWMKS